ncbi:MAG TPA: hypothetical protein VMI94_24770 [Bryobacteraceae bacterium]|nr:hypothetical protein [Bryobacteraceae bacterium]
MPVSARVYISVVSAAGATAIAYACFDSPWPAGLTRFLVYFLLSLLAATLKLRLPGLTGTMSIGFVFVLLGIAQLTLIETMAIACAGALVQCLWRAQTRPAPVQVLFSVSAVAVSLALAARGAESIGSAGRMPPVSALMAVAASLYFAANSLLVSGVLSLVKRQPLRTVWQQCFLFAFPYYLLGGAIAGLMTVSARDIGWQPSLLMLPVMGLIYFFYRVYLGRVAVVADSQ